MKTTETATLTKEKFNSILTAYIEQEREYIKEHEQIKEILRPLQGKPINGRTLNEKRLNGFKLKFYVSMWYIVGKYEHLIGYDSSENTIEIEQREQAIDEKSGRTIPKHRGFDYLDACHGRAAEERIKLIESTNKEKAYEIFYKIEFHFNKLRELFGEVEDKKLGSFDFPAYYSVLNTIHEARDRELKLTDFYFIRKFNNLNQNKMEKAVIYANESNIWDAATRKFCFAKNTVDEMSYAMPLEEAEKTLAEINEERKKEGLDEVYLNKITND